MRKGGMRQADAVGGLREEARSLVRHIENKTFYLQGGVWTDSVASDPKDAKAPRTLVKYLSDEYFELLKKKPRIGRYLALGERVIVVLDGMTYEIRP